MHFLTDSSILIDGLFNRHNLQTVLANPKYNTGLSEMARENAISSFGNKIYLKGLIEFTNYCKNSCYFCGLNVNNANCSRYRLSKQEILSCFKTGKDFGINSYILQGGDDSFYSNERIVEIIKAIRRDFKDPSLTLSMGERSYESYKSFYEAGLKGYILHHESHTLEHFNMLHSDDVSLFNRLNSIKNIRQSKLYTGCGLTVGFPYQTLENIADDILYIYDLNPRSVTVMPFIPHKDTVFANESSGNAEIVFKVISILRIMLPKAIIFSHYSLDFIHKKGVEKGILSGANAVTLSLAPFKYRKKYNLYTNKIAEKDSIYKSYEKLQLLAQKTGGEISTDY